MSKEIDEFIIESLIDVYFEEPVCFSLLLLLFFVKRFSHFFAPRDQAYKSSVQTFF